MHIIQKKKKNNNYLTQNEIWVATAPATMSGFPLNGQIII